MEWYNEQQNLYTISRLNEDDENFIETVYYIHLNTIVLSDVCNLENLYTPEMMFIYVIQVSFSRSAGGVHFIE